MALDEKQAVAGREAATARLTTMPREYQDMEPAEAPPPAYGEMHHFELTQPGLDAGAAVTGDGRVNISINQKNRRLAELLGPLAASQSYPQAGPPPAYHLQPPHTVDHPATTARPTPPLNIVIQIVGSRGDVQPFVALGKVLRESYGHRVRIATHPTFRTFVEDHSLEFFSIGGDPAELMAFMVKHPGLMPGLDAITSGEIRKRREGVQGMLLGCWRSCIEAGDGLGPPPQPHGRFEAWDPEGEAGMKMSGVGDGDGDGRQSQRPFVADAIIANPPSFAHVHIAEKLGIPLHMMFTMPWSPTRAFPHPLANVQSTNTDDAMTNYLTYRLVEMMTWQGLGDVINRFREKTLDLAPLEMIWAPGLLQRLKISYTYCWSPALIPKPNDWGPHIDVAGFFFLNLASSYVPDPSLAAFLDAGPPPVYIGFGSIVVDDPNAMTRLIFDAIHLAGVRALVSKGWGGLGADAVGIPEGVFMLGNVPHDWLFERVSCVVHHGGAGTTAAGIKAGKPTVVVPFFGDQPFWGSMISRAKAGPDPIPHAALTAERLAEAIKFCLRPETRGQARALGEKIHQERGAETGALSFHAQLDLDSLRCSVMPDQVAAWRVRRTNVRLSPLAAAVLADRHLLEYTDLKLHRPCEYNTEGQPPEPITAGASAIMADISSVGMSLFADLPRDMFKLGRTNAQPGPANKDKTARGESSTALEPSSSTSNTASPQPDSSSSSSNSITSRNTPSSNPGSIPFPSPPPSLPPISSKTAATIDATLLASRGISRAVTVGVKSPMNFCLGLAKGFRNIPRLYNDDTVREAEKVTDLTSGLKIAGKGLGLGFYDGVSGLVTQPMRGAQRDGIGGLVKGFGKGIGGLIVKPAAGIWGLPAYVMQGAYAEINKLLARSAQNYIMTSRVLQGRLALDTASAQEIALVVRSWTAMAPALKPYYAWKKKQAAAEKAPDLNLTDSTALSQSVHADAAPGPAWRIPRRPLPSARSTSTDQQYEEAIRASVRETSRGDAAEDAVIETAVRESVNAAREQGALSELDKSALAGSIFQDREYQITDEEYQDLIAQATLASIASQGEDHDQDAEFHRAMKHSLPRPPQAQEVDEDEELERALAASRDDMEKDRAERTEEDIVMEYVKRQSLAEAQYRKLRDAGRQDEDGHGEEEEMRRAIEESLRLRGASGS